MKENRGAQRSPDMFSAHNSICAKDKDGKHFYEDDLTQAEFLKAAAAAG